VLSRLQRIPDVKVATPQGAFYVLPDVSAYYGKSPPDGSQVVSSATNALILCVFSNALRRKLCES
jgi:aspartate aminotransferase